MRMSDRALGDHPARQPKRTAPRPHAGTIALRPLRTVTLCEEAGITRELSSN
jgi:hypothetical protein